MTPSGMRGVLNDAVSIFFLDATLASAFVARWCAASKIETEGGLFRIRDDGRGSRRDCIGLLKLRRNPWGVPLDIAPSSAICSSSSRVTQPGWVWTVEGRRRVARPWVAIRVGPQDCFSIA